MFDIGFTELVLIFIIGLVVLGPQKMPVAIRTVTGWIRTLRGMATTVQNELAQELKLQELQDSIAKVENIDVSKLSPELSEQIEELKQSASKLSNDVKQQTGEIDRQLRESEAMLAQAKSEQEHVVYEDELSELVEGNEHTEVEQAASDHASSSITDDESHKA